MIVPVRSPDKAKKAIEGIARAKLVPMDLGEPKTIVKGARVLSLSSRGHPRCAVDFGDTMFERRPLASR